MKTKIFKPTIITDGGPWADHDMPCPVCQKNSAVLQIWNKVFQPCWECQKASLQLNYRNGFLNGFL